MELSQLFILSGACIVAYSLKGFSGFGPALIFVPTVTLLFRPTLALASSAFIDLLVSVALLASLRYERGDSGLIFKMSALVAVGAAIGASLAGFVPRGALLAVIGGATIIIGLNFVLFHAPLPEERLSGSKLLWIGSLAGGLTGGLVGVSGPPVIVAARGAMDKERFRRVLVAVFFVEGVVKLGVYALVGVWDFEALSLAAWAGPAVILGLVIGYRSHFKVSERLFTAVIGVVLLALGIRVIASLIA